jgi:hypothetical protein
VADLTFRLGIAKPTTASKPSPAPEPQTDQPSDGNAYDSARDLYDDDMPDIPPGTPDPDGGDSLGTDAGPGGHGRAGPGPLRGTGQATGGPHDSSGDHGRGGGKGSGSARRTPSHTRGRPFISYVATHPNDEILDPDDLDQAARMKIEGHAIDLIIDLEPSLHRTPDGNAGFDLFEMGRDGKQTRWVEVKSMTGTLANRPVGLSRTQFDYAREKGDAYWLYVVEHAADPAQARVLRIQDPAGHARTFTFDHGWSEIAQTAPPTRIPHPPSSA